MAHHLATTVFSKIEVRLYMYTARCQHVHEQRLRGLSTQTPHLLQDTTHRGGDAQIRGRGLGSIRHTYGEMVMRLGAILESATSMSCDCKWWEPNGASRHA